MTESRASIGHQSYKSQAQSSRHIPLDQPLRTVHVLREDHHEPAAL